MDKRISYFLNCFIVIIILFSQPSFARCILMNSAGQFVDPTQDALGTLLFSDLECPYDVFSLRKLLINSGLKLETTLVANRGFHNPSQGSFSLFEMVIGNLNTGNNQLSVTPGDFFFGHFTGVNSEGNLVADQNTEKNSLMIEAFAWDAQKGVFNFYELRGNGTQGQWYYRGDSMDIFADIELLHRQLDPQHPKFGSRLRCSGCHGEGGPIMKELDHPQNDWWEPTRPLDFGGHEPDSALQNILETLVPAERLAQNVLLGINKLNNSERSSLSLQEQLRPLFCPVELNLMSDVFPNEEHQEINIPAEFIVDSRLLQNTKLTLHVSRINYQEALKSLGSYFPEIDAEDADHAWLTPVKAKSDRLAIDRLIKNRIIDQKFVLDVLDIDMTNPVFSSKRCSLLQYIPNETTLNWRELLIKNLSHSQDKTAKELLKNLISPQNDAEYYSQKSNKLLKECQLKLQNKEHVLKMYRLLVQRREEIRTSEISLNPRGQILEPGFRVIFPENKVAVLPGELRITPTCDVIEQ